MNDFKRITCAILVLALAISSTQASIEKEPVKVTRQNSGPRYDIDEVERTKLSSEQEQPQQQPNGNGGQFARFPFRFPVSPNSNGEGNNNQENEGSIGHVTLRRIFLIPMPRPLEEGDSASDSAAPAGSSSSSSKQPEMENPLLASILRGLTFTPKIQVDGERLSPMPSGERHHQHHRHHLLGSDEASRPPMSMNGAPTSMGAPKPEGGEQGESSMERPQPIPFDPVPMMIQMMHHALSSMPMPMPPQGVDGGDLNKEAATTKPDSGTANNEATTNTKNEVEKSIKPLNETREDIVEIEGKKYIRKTVLNRHVGENFVFMTRRLIFVPLNETTGAEAAPTTTQSPVTTTPLNSDPAPTTPTIVASSETTTTTTTTTPAEPSTTESPSSTSVPAESEASTAAPEQKSSTTSLAPEVSETPEEATTPKESLMDKVSGAFDRAAERLVEGAAEMISSTTTTTEKPSA